MYCVALIVSIVLLIMCARCYEAVLCGVAKCFVGQKWKGNDFIKNIPEVGFDHSHQLLKHFLKKKIYNKI